MPTLPDPLSGLPSFEELRARAERAAAAALSALAELQATLGELYHRCERTDPPAAPPEHGEQAPDPPGIGKAPPP